jgi:superfamily II DNA helicase RecQ
VQVVINFTMPHNLTQYIHRVGRTARAGKRGTAVTLVGESERKLLKEIVKVGAVPAADATGIHRGFRGLRFVRLRRNSNARLLGFFEDDVCWLIVLRSRCYMVKPRTAFMRWSCLSLLGVEQQ